MHSIEQLDLLRRYKQINEALRICESDLVGATKARAAYANPVRPRGFWTEEPRTPQQNLDWANELSRYQKLVPELEEKQKKLLKELNETNALLKSAGIE